MPEVRKWFLDYFQALLREYGEEVDGFVLDETNYFSAGAVSDPAETFDRRSETSPETFARSVGLGRETGPSAGGHIAVSITEVVLGREGEPFATQVGVFKQRFPLLLGELQRIGVAGGD